MLTVVALILLAYFLWVKLNITNGELGAPLDDAWIHFQFARNISQGYGFSFNPGEPTPGSTAPLWTLILAGIGFFTSDFLIPAIALSVFFFLLSVWLAFGFAYWVTNSYLAAIVAGLGTIFAGRFLWAGAAAMETTAFAALSLAAVWTYSKWGLKPFPAILFALASQLRPEGHALFALAVVDSLWQLWPGRGLVTGRHFIALARIMIPPLLIYALISLPYSLFSLSVTGRPLPNTFYAKVGSEYFFSIRTLQETLSWHRQDNPMSILLLLAGLLPLWRRSRLAVLWIIGLPLFTAFVIDFTWHHGRYTMPLIPLQMVAAATGFHFLLNKSHVFIDRDKRTQVVIALVLLIIFAIVGIRQLPYWASMLGNNAREIQDIDIRLGEWLAENSSEDALIAVDDIGAIGFLSERRIIDLNGLVSPEVWPAYEENEGLPRNQLLTRILSRSKPEFMAAFPLWRWDIATNPAVAQPVFHVNTETHTIIFQQDAAVYEMTWPYIEHANPENDVLASFGEGIRLLGYDLILSDAIELTIYWENMMPVIQSYDVFIHMVDDNGQIVAQVDQKPVGGLVETDLWQVGDIIRDPVEIAIAGDLLQGTYELRLGMYLRESGERLRVKGANSKDNALILEPIVLP